MQIFQYAIILNERRDKTQDLVIEEAKVVVPVTEVLAKDEKTAQMLAARSIPEDQLQNMDRLVVVVRPF